MKISEMPIDQLPLFVHQRGEDGRSTLFITRSLNGKFYCHCKVVLKFLPFDEGMDYLRKIWEHELVDDVVSESRFISEWKDKVEKTA